MHKNNISDDMRLGEFNIFQRQSDPDFLVAVPQALPRPPVLASGWRFCCAMASTDTLPESFDMNEAQQAIARDGYYVFDASGEAMTNLQTAPADQTSSVDLE